MKSRKRLILLLLILTSMVIFLSNIGYSANVGDVYIIPIKGEINKGTYDFLKHTMDRVINENTKAIIFEIDTYGGLIDEAENIKNLIVSSPVPTISYVNSKAQSAGVLITIASEKIVMANTATIGSAETIPNTEKILSMWRSFLRDTAQLRGRNTEIIEAMADRDMEIDSLVERGKLVNLTSSEAVKYGIADLATDDYNEILAHFNLGSANIQRIDESLQDKLSKYISNPYISSLLITIGFIGLIVEVLTPGFGLGGTASIVAFSLYFGGNILAGNSRWTSLVIFVTGLILLVIEGIVPGFGLPGIGGIVLVLAGIILAMDSLAVAVVSLSVAIIITSIVSIVLIKMGFKSKLLNKVVLNTQHKDEDGYLSADSMHEYLNKEGSAITELHPSGFIEIDGIKLDALSEGGFILKGSSVKVVRVEGSKIFVGRV